jgi:hypothetical protein
LFPPFRPCQALFDLTGPLGAKLFSNLQDMPLAQRTTYIRLFQACGELWHKSVSIASLPDLQHRVVEAVCMAELHLPATEADIKMHNLVHLAFDVLPEWGECEAGECD